MSFILYGYVTVVRAKENKNAVSSNIYECIQIHKVPRTSANVWRGLHNPEYIRRSHLNCNNKEWGKRQP